MRILAVDTATRTGSVAVLEDDTLVAEVQVTSSETHAKRLMSVVDCTLHMAGIKMGALDGFAVTTGPGSFTGLRIGISAIKGFSFATGRPVTGVSTLDALAYQFPWCRLLICPLLDARKAQVYTALYRGGRDGDWEKVVSDRVVNPRQWLMRIEGLCLFVGDGARLYKNLIKDILGSRARFVEPYLNTLRASVVAHVGLKQIKEGQIVNVARLAPYYIRKSDAEIKLEQGKVG
jgi:tRNA threonylcarbamoyladenosine biosynthesis protein TsaB